MATITLEEYNKRIANGIKLSLPIVVLGGIPDNNKYPEPKCFTPNNDPYPLCIGGKDKNCINCNLYEDMDESQYYE